MAVLEKSVSLDELKRVLSDTVKEKSGMNYSKEEYWSNDDFTQYGSGVPSGSKARFYFDQAENQGNLDVIQNNVDPIAFTVKATYRVSTGMLSSHTHYVEFEVFDLSRLRMLSQGKEVAIGGGPQTFEVWESVCSKSHTRATEFHQEVIDELLDNN